MKYILTHLLILTLCHIGISQSKKLSDFQISAFYSQDIAAKNALNELEISVDPISLTDIESDFNNMADLSWIESVSKKNKVVLIGETHYSEYISNIKTRIIFALNTFDYFPLIIIEQPYSLSAFINHFVHLKNDEEAKSFFYDELDATLNSKEDSIFFEHVRRWNIKKPKKDITIGCNDLEWAYDEMCEQLLLPYFNKLEGVEPSKISEIIELGKRQTNEFFEEVKPLMEAARQQGLVGKYAFIDHEYIGKVIANFSSTNNALRYSFDYYRQKAITDRIQDEDYYGSYFKDQKVILYGGGDHMKSNFSFPDGGNFLSEGSYLNHDFEPTANKVYSIMISALSYSLGEMQNIDINECISQGMQYQRILKRMQSAFDEELISADDNYFLFGRRTDFERFLVSQSYQNPDQAISIPADEWNKIEASSETFDVELSEIISKEKEASSMYDYKIYVPYSPIFKARKRVASKQ